MKGLALSCLALAALVALAAAPSRGHTFYVDATRGSDTNDGRSEHAPFKTISKAISESSAPIGPGDSVLIKAGLYRERPFVRKSGTAAAPIVIAAFGDGEVVLDASTAVGGWTLANGQVYRSRPGFKPTAVVVAATPLLPEPNAAALVAGRYFFDAGTGELHVWRPGGGPLDAKDVGVVKDDEYEQGFTLQEASFVTLRGLTVRFAGGHGISILGDHVRVEKCKVLFNGKAGINVFGYGSTASADAEIVENEIAGNVLRNWPRGRYKWGGWAMGAVSNGTPRIRYEGNLVHGNGGEGLGAYGGPGGSIFRDNVVYDNWSVNIYVDNQPDARIENNLIYATTPNPLDLHGNGDTEPGDGKCLRRLRPEGIMTADEKASSNPPAPHLRNITIVNNLILNCRRGIQHYGETAGSGLKGVRVLHNTIVVPDAEGTNEAFVGISIPYNGGNNAGALYENNIVYARHPSSYLLYGGASSRDADGFAGLTLGHNLWFHAGRAKALHWGPDGSRYDYEHAAWAALPGPPHADGDVVEEPRLVNAASVVPGDLRPANAASPAVDRGIEAGVASDFGHGARPVNGRPDIGAWEFGAKPSPIQ